MPMKPRRPCRMAGCPNFAEDGEQYCPVHKGAAEYEYNRFRRDPDAQSRYGRAWKRIRDRYIQKHPLCEDCITHGVYKAAEEVHHILPLADGGTHDESNLKALCRSCHLKEHGALGTRVPYRLDR